MLRPASVKGVIRSKENDALRSPELVDRVWDDAVDGAWAPGKASLPLLSAFLQHLQDEDVEQAEQTAQAILAVEPQNRLVQDLVAAMKQQLALEDQLESEEESGEEEEDEAEDDENEEEGEEDEEDEEEDETPEINSDEK